MPRGCITLNALQLRNVKISVWRRRSARQKEEEEEEGEEEEEEELYGELNREENFANEDATKDVGLTFLGGGCMLDERPALQPHRWQPVLHRPPGRGALLFSYASPDTILHALPPSLLACPYATDLLSSTELAYLLIAHAPASSRSTSLSFPFFSSPSTPPTFPPRSRSTAILGIVTFFLSFTAKFPRCFID